MTSRPVKPDLSVIIPVYNRGEVIRYTLESVRRASDGLSVESIVVDDGSTTAVADTIARLGYSPTKVTRQANQGLLFARLNGLREATGRYTLFLDSDDLVSAEKFRAQIAAMDATQADLSYTDAARATLAGAFDELVVVSDPPIDRVTDSAEFFIMVQPGPHNPIFRTDYLQRVVTGAFIPPSAHYNPVAEIWFYHNASVFPARIVKVPGPHTIVGQHPGARLTNHWEKLGVASLAVMEAFARHCPDTPATAAARRFVAAKAFQAWRRLPRGFPAEFCARELDIWRRLDPQRRVDLLGEPGFRRAARLLGAERTARWLRTLRGGAYAKCRTVDDTTLAALMRSLPPA